MGRKGNGAEVCAKNLSAEIKKIVGNGIAGLLEGGMIVERAAKQKVSVENGKLRASGYSRKAQGNPKAVEIGFSANYAAAVHEARKVNAGKKRKSGKGVYWGPAGEPGYLANAVTENREAVLAAVLRHARKK